MDHSHFTPTFPSLGYGVGLRTRHYRDFLQQSQAVDWLEIHTENYFGAGVDLDVLETLRADYPISMHGVGLGIGSVNGYELAHVEKIKQLADRIHPALISEHLCWAAVTGRHLNDLLPMPLMHSALNMVCERIDHLQNTLKQRVMIENVSTYVRFSSDDMSETEFLKLLVQRTGCGILLDVNNLYVNQINHGESAYSALASLRQLPENSIGEIHLAGHLVTESGLVDHHGCRVDAAVWSLYERARLLFGDQIPTLIEWDTDIPELDIIIDETNEARIRSQRVREESKCAQI